ncbi:MAG: sulfite exporter TauE/SafE family protein [bacterium]|jgi:hypothetical protein
MPLAKIVLLGLLAGLFAGFFGLGGGVILIPALVYILGVGQHEAQGISLMALIPPVGLLAVWRYWREGVIGIEQIPIAAWIAVGIFAGGLAGAHLVQYVPDETLKRIFGIVVIAVGLKMLIKP